ncbi:MAG: hypothetical protein JW864_12345 [Spirochaetes bacterium]|nr:hypothetical protein [Spirochaetota bacterium]
MRKIFLLLLCCLFFNVISEKFADSQELIKKNTENGDSRQKITAVLNLLKEILESNDWYVNIESGKLIAFCFRNNCTELTVGIDHNSGKNIHNYTVTVVTDRLYEKVITIKDEFADDSMYVRNKIIPYVLQKINASCCSSSNNKKIYFGSISAGYNRTHDNCRFYPEYSEGSFYMSGSLAYDPAANVTARSITLKPADYFFSSFSFTIDSTIRENSFNVNLLIYGKNKFESAQNQTRRTLYGFFNGFEYFRPGFNDPVLKWNRQIYKKQPHVQFGLYRAIQGTIINTSQSETGVFTNYLSLAVGPGINSSLTATGITEEEEDELSHIFKSIKYRKQNYYYSAAAAANAGFIADRIHNFRFGADYNFYFFIPVEGEKAYDLMNILKISAGYYLTQNTLFAVNYEFWHIDSMLKDDRVNHSWNRLIIELKYLL